MSAKSKYGPKGMRRFGRTRRENVMMSKGKQFGSMRKCAVNDFWRKANA